VHEFHSFGWIPYYSGEWFQFVALFLFCFFNIFFSITVNRMNSSTVAAPWDIFFIFFECFGGILFLLRHGLYAVVLLRNLSKADGIYSTSVGTFDGSCSNALSRKLEF